MSDKQWTELTGGRRLAPSPPLRPPAAAPALELVKDAPPIFDAFDDPQAYEAVRSLHSRSADVYLFVPGRGPSIRPYSYFQGVDWLPDDSGILLLWPGIRFEVRGDNLMAAMGRLTQRRADVWRIFRPGFHVAPERGATLIRSIEVIRDDDAERGR